MTAKIIDIAPYREKRRRRERRGPRLTFNLHGTYVIETFKTKIDWVLPTEPGPIIPIEPVSRNPLPLFPACTLGLDKSAPTTFEKEDEYPDY